MRTFRILKPLRESILRPPHSRILSSFLLTPPHNTRSEEEESNTNLTEDFRFGFTSCLHTSSRRVGGGGKRRFEDYSFRALNEFLPLNCSRGINCAFGLVSFGGGSYHHRLLFRHDFCSKVAEVKKTEIDDPSQRAVTTALWANFLVFSLKFGVWWATSSHVILAEVIHSVADFANQALLAYGLNSSRRAPDAIHPYGYSKERFVWSLISAVGIFCLGSGATIVHGFQNLWTSQPPPNIQYAALVIGGSFIIEGASLVVAIHAVRTGAAAEGMKMWDYVWRGHDPTSVAVMTEDGAAVTGLLIAAASLVAVNKTGNAIYDPIGSIVVGNLLGMWVTLLMLWVVRYSFKIFSLESEEVILSNEVAIFLIQRNRHALIGRAIDDHDMERVLRFLKNDPVVDALYDCKSEVIGPGFFRFKAEIDFNGVVVVQNYLKRTGREEWAKQFREAGKDKDDDMLLKTMSNYGEEVVTALGSEVDRLEKEIQKLVPGIRHVDIEAHNPEKEIPKIVPGIRNIDIEALNPKGPSL